MRKINTRHFRLATRQTQRDVNQLIALNLIREFGPISRAELARRMELRRGSMTAIVRALLARKLVEELPAETVVRGRRPLLLSIRVTGRLIAAADVRPVSTFLALADKSGRVVARAAVDTPRDPAELPQAIARGLRALASDGGAPAGRLADRIFGLGVVVPGMIDRDAGRLLYSPRLGWRDVELRDPIARLIGVRTHLESAPIACALARLWLSPEQTRTADSFAYVHVSDGIGVGLVLNGEAVRGETHSAGEFGHVVLDPTGPACVCGKHGCWEALASNSATIARFAAGDAGQEDGAPVGIYDVVRGAKDGDAAAVRALEETGAHIGRGLALVVSAFNPGLVYLGGEVTAAWELLEAPIRAALERDGIMDAARRTPVIPDGKPGEQRLRGAAALVSMPAYAALAVG